MKTLITAAAGALLALTGIPVQATAAADASDYGQHVRNCAQTMGFDGEHNPGMHHGFSGFNPDHDC
jgi:hypothetical protein